MLTEPGPEPSLTPSRSLSTESSFLEFAGSEISGLRLYGSLHF